MLGLIALALEIWATVNIVWQLDPSSGARVLWVLRILFLPAIASSSG